MKEESFLERWARKKAETQRPEEESTPPEASLEASAVDVPATTDTPPEPHPAERIDLETLSFESDYTVFMQKGVPEDIKRKALAKLWTSDPVLANLDGLTDYDLDLSPHGHGPFTGTSWRLGSGYNWLDALEKLSEPEPASTETPEDSAPVETDVVAEGEAPETIEQGPADVDAAPDTADVPTNRHST